MSSGFLADFFHPSLTSVQISCLPRRTSLDVTMERFSHGRLDSVSLGWTRHGRLEQVQRPCSGQQPSWEFSSVCVIRCSAARFHFLSYLQVKAISSWCQSEELNETKVELRQPFTSTLGQMSLHMLSQSSLREQHSSQQVHLYISKTLKTKYDDSSFNLFTVLLDIVFVPCPPLS